MIDSILNLARASIRQMKAYSSARSLCQDAEIFLDANENPFPAQAQGALLNRYPEPQPRDLRKVLSQLYGVLPESMMIGRGSDEAIEAVLRVFCDTKKEEEILICPPTYGVYSITAEIQGTPVKQVPLNAADFSINKEAIVEACTENTKVLFLCSPNNPTGTVIPQEDLLDIISRLAERVIVVVDEAYIEFSDQESLAAQVEKYPNVIVLRTLSKAWGLAGVRCGVAIAHPQVIALMQKVRAPYPMSTPATRVLVDWLEGPGPSYFKESLAQIHEQKRRLIGFLKGLRSVEKIYASDANFLLVRFFDSQGIMQACREQGIVLRDRSSELGLENCIRISVGTPEENDRLFSVLKDWDER